MRVVRRRARLVAGLVLTWHVASFAAVPAVSCADRGASTPGVTTEHADMANCPMHQAKPVCPLHAEKQAPHECNCPTIGCSRDDTAFLALFGAVGILSSVESVQVTIVDATAARMTSSFASRLASRPLLPPPRV
jgi:hypothetical protein